MGGLGAYKRVKANKGAAGVDEQTIKDFEKRFEKESLQDLESNVIRQLLSSTSTDGEDTKANVGKENWAYQLFRTESRNRW